MIRRIRAAAPMVISIAAVIGAVGLALNAGSVLGQVAPEPPTWAEISLLVWTRYGGAVATSILATWGLLAYFQGREDKRRTELVRMVEGMNARLLHHDNDENAHVQMNEHQNAMHHGPLNGRAKEIEEKLDSLILDLTAAGALARNKRRSTDPQTGGDNDSGDDFTNRRGRR